MKQNTQTEKTIKNNEAILKGTIIFIVKLLGYFKVLISFLFLLTFLFLLSFLFLLCVFSFFFYLQPASQFRHVENDAFIAS